MGRPRGVPVLAPLLLSLALVSASDVRASDLPWSRAEMVARKLFLSARTTLSLEPGDDPTTAVLRVDSRFIGRHTESRLIVDRASGATRERWKIQYGGDPYSKTYAFEGDIVRETRRAPARSEEKDLPPERWTDVRESEHPVPDGCVEPIHPEALFWLLSTEAPTPDQEPLRTCAFTGEGFVRLTLRPIRVAVEPREFELGEATDPRPEAEEIELLELQLDGQALDGDAAAEIDFLGLEGTIGLSLDRRTGAPVRVRGEIPPVGTVVVKLERLVP